MPTIADKVRVILTRRLQPTIADWSEGCEHAAGYRQAHAGIHTDGDEAKTDIVDVPDSFVYLNRLQIDAGVEGYLGFMLQRRSECRGVSGFDGWRNDGGLSCAGYLRRCRRIPAGKERR